MKNLIFCLFTLLLSSTDILSQEFCETTGANFNDSYRTTCNMLELSFPQEVQALPYVTYKVALHFIANSSGENFTCDPNDPILQQAGVSELLYAPLFLKSSLKMLMIV